MEAIADRVIVREDTVPTETDSGIILPVDRNAASNQGTVLSVGPRAQDVKVGDHVLFTAYDGREVKDENGDPIVVLADKEILAVIDD